MNRFHHLHYQSTPLLLLLILSFQYSWSWLVIPFETSNLSFSCAIKFASSNTTSCFLYLLINTLFISWYCLLFLERFIHFFLCHSICGIKSLIDCKNDLLTGINSSNFHCYDRQTFLARWLYNICKLNLLTIGYIMKQRLRSRKAFKRLSVPFLYRHIYFVILVVNMC